MNQSISEEKMNQNHDGVEVFSYHKHSGYIGFTCAMIGVIVLESVGVSFLLYNWSPLLHWLHLALCIVIGVFLVMGLRAVINNPITVKNNELSFKIGLRPRVTIDTSAIKELKSGNINYENDRKNKELLDLSLLGFDAPTFELVLHNSIIYKDLIGKERPISRIFFSVDDKQTFYNMITK